MQVPSKSGPSPRSMKAVEIKPVKLWRKLSFIEMQLELSDLWQWADGTDHKQLFEPCI